MHLPSASTVRSHLYLPQLQLSIGSLTTSEIIGNINSFFGPEVMGSRPFQRVGLSLMLDEIALELRASGTAYSRTLLLARAKSMHTWSLLTT
jgi:hypothetical protein